MRALWGLTFRTEMSAHKHGICSMTTVVRCPRTGRACSEGACRERHWCRSRCGRRKSTAWAACRWYISWRSPFGRGRPVDSVVTDFGVQDRSQPFRLKRLGSRPAIPAENVHWIVTRTDPVLDGIGRGSVDAEASFDPRRMGTLSRSCIPWGVIAG